MTSRYLNIPLYGAMAPIMVAGGEFDIGARYVTALERCQPRIAEVLAAIANAETGAVLFRCTAGKDRTGIVAALLLTLSRAVPRETVVADCALTSEAERLLVKLRDQYGKELSARRRVAPARQWDPGQRPFWTKSGLVAAEITEGLRCHVASALHATPKPARPLGCLASASDG